MTPRLRNRDVRIAQANLHLAEQYQSSNCVSRPSWSTYYNSPQSTSVGTYQSMYDYVVPNYRKRVQAGEVFFNYMDNATCVISNGSGSYGGQVVHKNPTCTSAGQVPYYPSFRFSLSNGSYGAVLSEFSFPIVNGLLLPPPPLEGMDISNMVLEAATECLAQRGTAESNLWEALAEADKSLGMLAQALQNIAQFLNGKRDLLTKAKAAGNMYLLYRYGLSPLISDLQHVIEGLEKKTGTLRLTSRGKASSEVSTSFYNTSPTMYNTWWGRRTYTIRETVSIRAMSLDEINVGKLFNIGLAPKSLLTLPWELIPYSFVVDWFVNIGALINALVPSLDLRQKGSCYVMIRERRETCELSNYQCSGLFNFHSQPSPAFHERTFTVRSRFPHLPGPALVIKTDFRLTNLKRALDALSLIIQRL